MRNRKKPEQMFHDGKMKITWRRFLAKVRFIMTECNFITNPEFD